ncbi:MAG TPA: cobyrinate a,c-diamide synthase [Micromonosporaceae bacterium]|nr:cobyrinate a,c-diamide synthase [Micromonosporaceae bacterium]
MTTIPRVVVSAPSSGHGKTAVSLGLLAALASRGLRCAGFKIGPDHIDAAYLGLASGRPGRNLDPRLVGGHRVGPLFAHGAIGADIAVVEGTMGLYDGLTGRTDVESTAQVAGVLRAPVVFVVDVAAMGQSVAALVHGFRAYDEVVWLGGVILNRVGSDRHEQLLREALDDIGVPVFGALRRGALVPAGPGAVPARTHGPVPVVHHSLEAVRAVRRLGEVVHDTVDVDRVLSLAQSAPPLATEPWSPAAELGMVDHAGPRPVVVVAGGPSSGYGYAETSELLRAAGAEVVPLDPLRDESLPAGTAALVLGGGLPESYAEELAANERLSRQVADLARAGQPVIAEGVGLVWLSRELDGRPMCGVLDTAARVTDLLVIGYREATAQTSSPLAAAGARLVGYKHHRTQVLPRAGVSPAWAWPGGQPEGFVWRGVHASFLNLHWAGAPEIAVRLVAAARQTAIPAPVPVSPAVPPAIPAPAHDEPATEALEL